MDRACGRSARARARLSGNGCEGVVDSAHRAMGGDRGTTVMVRANVDRWRRATYVCPSDVGTDPATNPSSSNWADRAMGPGTSRHSRWRTRTRVSW